MILSRDELVKEFGSTFEHSSWIAEAAFEAGAFQGVSRAADGVIRLNAEEVNRIHMAMCEAFRAAPREKRLEVLRAHPDLAGRLAVARELSRDSENEQRGAGLDRLTPDEHDRFLHLNLNYQARYGFPFIVAVKGLDKRTILQSFQKRVHSEPEAEFERACAEVERIARFRLEARMDDA